MTYWMDNEQENRRSLQNLVDPLAPVPVESGPGFTEGALSAPFQGAWHGYSALSTVAGDLTIPYLQEVADPIDDVLGTNASAWLEGQREKAHDITRRYRVDPNTTGEVGRILHGAASVITQAAVGSIATGGTAGAAIAAGAGTGYEEYNQLVESGVDPETAKRVAGITAVDTAVGVALPMTIGGGVWGAMAWGAGSNAALGAAGRYDSGKVLADAGYTDMAEQYKVLDGVALATDVLMGSAFPVAGHFINKARARLKPGETLADRLTPEQVDAVDVAARQYHDDVETSPGLHKSPESMNAHYEALRVMEDEVLVNGKDPSEVNLDPIIQRMDLEPDARRVEDRRSESRGTPDRRVREPHEILRADFEARARAAGLTDESIIEALAPKPEIDSATGWNNLQGKKFVVQEVVKDALRVAEETGTGVHYVSMDLQNLGGLNAFYKEVYSHSDAEFRNIMSIMRGELDKIGGSAYMRTGGDELSAVVSGADPAKIQGALDKAFVKIKEYAASKGYGEIDHAKGKPVKGVNVYGGFQEVRPGMSVSKIIDAADAAMGMKKQAAIDAAEAALKEGGDVNGKPAEAPRDGESGGQGRQDQPGASEAPRATDGGTGEGSEPVRAAFDPTDPEAVARAGDISTTDEAATTQAIDAMPDLTVPHPDTGKSVSARELMAELDREIETAKQDGDLASVAVACFKTFGD